MITLTVNGNKHEFTGDPSTPVLWYLRDELNLTGPKFGCGMAQCGACTIHIDGVAQRSCILPVSAVAGRAITSIEGLSEQGDHPVQKAWLEHKVPQCGYCQSGQIMSAAALLAKNPNPSAADVDAAMAGNICRCGTFNRVRRGIHLAAEIKRGGQPS